MRGAPTVRNTAWAGGGEGLEKPELTLGFVPLTDSAPLIVAKERGMFRRRGLHVHLSREPSWSNVRDKLTAGVFDGAQMLAPMTLASTLGLGGLACPTVTGLSLDLNGNAITVSHELHAAMEDADPDGVAEAPPTARALKRLIERRDRPLTFGVVFPFSSHNYALRYWLAAGGVDPDRDLRIHVVPPPAMAAQLREGRLDGYCVGEPWNRFAEREGIGRRLVAGYEIWSNAPEKVFAVTREWAERHPRTHVAVLGALIEAGRWLDDPGNRLEASHIIAGESWVDAPVAVVRDSLLADSPPAERDFHVFHRYAAGFPWHSHGAWFLSQMLRWGQLEKPIRVHDVVAQVYRPDLYRAAATVIGVAHPTVDAKVEGAHPKRWTLEDATSPIAMGPDTFLDGKTFDPDDVVGYLERFEITDLRVRLDELAAINAPIRDV